MRHEVGAFLADVSERQENGEEKTQTHVNVVALNQQSKISQTAIAMAVPTPQLSKSTMQNYNINPNCGVH